FASGPGCARTAAAWCGRSASRGALEHVAGSALGVEQARLASGLELAAQVGDEDVDGVGLFEGVVAPDVLEQPLARDDQLLVAGEVLEQLELAVGELDLALATLHLAGVGVDDEVADHDRRAAARRAAPEQGPDSRQQLGALEGLGQVIVGTRVEALD